MFCTHAFGTNGFSSNQELMKMAKDVCNEFKGLPLALKVIGSAMERRMILQNEDQHYNIYKSPMQRLTKTLSNYFSIAFESTMTNWANPHKHVSYILQPIRRFK